MGKKELIGVRLKEERERLGLNQSDFAGVAGVTRKTLFGYETAERAPAGDALAAWAEIGVDVLYVLTGARSGAIPVPKIEPISRREQALIANYRNSTEEGKRALEGVASATAHMDSGTKRQGGE